MTDRKLAIGAIVVALVCVIVVFFRPAQTIIREITGDTILGSSNINQMNYRVDGGIATYTSRTDSMLQSTSTNCAIKNPTGATTTLESATLSYTTASSTAAVFVSMAKTTPSPATSTPQHSSTTAPIIATYEIAAAADAYITATTSESWSADKRIFGPNDWLTVGMVTGTGGVDAASTGVLYTPTGTCQAVWKIIP